MSEPLAPLKRLVQFFSLPARLLRMGRDYYLPVAADRLGGCIGVLHSSIARVFNWPLELWLALGSRWQAVVSRVWPPPVLVHEFELLFFGPHRRYLISASIALAVLVSAGVGGAVAWKQNREEHLSRCAKEAERALARHDYLRSTEICRRLVALAPDDPAYRLALARSYEGLGRLDLAEQAVSKLVSKDALGYPPAQIWTAKRAIATQRPESIEEARIRLEQMISGRQATPEAYELLAGAYLDQQRVDRALACMAQAPARLPAIELRLAQLRATEGDASARAAGAELAELFRARVEKDEVADDRLHWAQATSLAGDLQAARQILNLGITLHGPEPFAIELARLYYEWGQALRREAPLSSHVRALWKHGCDALQQNQVHSAPLLLFQLHEALEEYSAAERLLLANVEAMPSLRVELAKFYTRRHQDREALTTAREALDYYRREVSAHPNDCGARLRGAEVAVLLREYETAVTMLSTDVTGSGAPQLATALSNVYVAWWDARVTGKVRQPAEEHPFGLLELALDSRPDNRQVLSRLLRFEHENDADRAQTSRLLGRIRSGSVTRTQHSPE